MNARTMFSRENFTEVLLDTIKVYYQQVHGVDVELSLEKKKGFRKLYLYSTPLFVSGFPICKGAKTFLYSEYNIRGSILKYIIGKMGVFLIVHSYGLGAFQRIYIGAKEQIDTSIFISPCNRTVRFYDFKHDIVTCVLKNGYQPLFLNNQLDFRLESQYGFVPKVLERGENWYTEKIMWGHALARVRDVRLHKHALETVDEYISQLAGDTFSVIEGQEYFNNICQELEMLCDALLDNQGQLLDKTAYALEILKMLVKEAKLMVPTCISHGDLQEGNVWVTNDSRVLIYDWETCSRRSVWYDPVTLHYSIRSGIRRSDLFHCLKTDDRWLVNDTCKYYSNDQLVGIVNVLFLEDVLFQMQEAFQLSPQYGRKRAKEVMENFVEQTEEGIDGVKS